MLGRDFLFLFKFKTIYFSIIPLTFLACYSIFFEFASLFPWGMTLSIFYFSYLKVNFDLDFSFRHYRRFQITSFFALSLLPLAQFALSANVLWAVLSLWPVVYGIFHSLHNNGKTIREHKIIMTMLSLEVVSYFCIRSFIHQIELTSTILETVFIATMFLPYHFYIKNLQSDRIEQIKRKSLSVIDVENHQIDPLKEQKYFYHDLINKTHGMSLFVSEKIRAQKAELNDLMLLQKEIQSLQVIIRDHAEIKHRNLAPVREWISYLEFRPRIGQLMRTYFAHRSVSMSENYPKIETDLQHFYLHAPSFERALGNLFKNAFEASAEFVEVVINISDKELVFIMKNDLKDKKVGSFQLADRLSQDILRGENDEAPLGLESIHFLVSRMNGEFQFGHEQGFWISKIVIPNSRHIQQKSVQKSDKDSKPKAA